MSDPVQHSMFSDHEVERINPLVKEVNERTKRIWRLERQVAKLEAECGKATTSLEAARKQIVQQQAVIVGQRRALDEAERDAIDLHCENSALSLEVLLLQRQLDAMRPRLSPHCIQPVRAVWPAREWLKARETELYARLRAYGAIN